MIAPAGRRPGFPGRESALRERWPKGATLENAPVMENAMFDSPRNLIGIFSMLTPAYSVGDYFRIPGLILLECRERRLLTC